MFNILVLYLELMFKFPEHTTLEMIPLCNYSYFLITHLQFVYIYKHIEFESTKIY